MFVDASPLLSNTPRAREGGPKHPFQGHTREDDGPQAAHRQSSLARWEASLRRSLSWDLICPAMSTVWA